MRPLMLGVALLLAPAASRADEAALRGRAAIERFGCARCHAIPGLPADERSGCAPCHQGLAKRPRSGLGRAPVATHFVDVPDLGRVTRRLRPDAIARFVSDPHDVRPHLEESMPRLPVGIEEARAIVAYLEASTPERHGVPADAPAPDRANMARGRAVFAAAGCPTCHTFGNVDFGTGATPELYRLMRERALLAPNLRFVRDRMDAGVALAWISDPTSVDPAARMPRPALSQSDAIAVRDFLFIGEPGAAFVAPPPPAAADVEPLDRPVRFAEVRRILGRSCVHCHAKTAGSSAARGLGFLGVALDLSTREGLLAGAELADGSRRSVLDAPAGGTAPLVARLLRRHAEAPRDVVGPYEDRLAPAIRATPDPGPVGMPLGLPPVPLADIRIIASWIAQGTPR